MSFPEESRKNSNSAEFLESKSSLKYDSTYLSNKSSRHRRGGSVGGALKAVREGSLFEYFIVAGYSSRTIQDRNDPTSKPNDMAQQKQQQQQQEEEREESPTILFKFPEEKPLDFEILPFCFPEHFKTKKVNRSWSLSEVHQSLLCQMSTLEKCENMYTFLIVHDKDVFYGCCVINPELIDRLPSFIKKSNSTTSNNNNNNNNRRVNNSHPSSFLSGEQREVPQNVYLTKRIYCFVSRFPFFKLHFDVLFGIIARERLYLLEEDYLTNPFGLISMEPNLKGSDNNAKGSSEASSDNLSSQSEENEVISILKTYNAFTVPRQGEYLSFNLLGAVSALRFHCPIGDEDQIIAEWSFPTLFGTMRTDSIITLLTYALLEYRILIVCPNIGVVSSLVLSFIPLLRPYTWQGALIPILPVKLSEYLQAPVPFIVGVTQLAEEMEKELSEVLIVSVPSIQKEIIKLPKKPIPSMLPGQKQLMASLKNAQYKLCKHPIDPEKQQPFPNNYKSSVDDIENVKKIMEDLRVFHQHFLSLLFSSGYRHLNGPHTGGTDNVNTNKEKLLHSVPKKTKYFIEQFLETQQFLDYMNTLSTEHLEAQEEAKLFALSLDEKLRVLESQRREAFLKLEACQRELKEYDEKISTLRKNQESALKNLSNISGGRDSHTRRRSIVVGSLEFLRSFQVV